MIYFADLHVHSKYSRATSRDCNLVELARWAALKGIRVLATGDFTHPEWSREIREMLEEADDGLFRLKDAHVPQDILLPQGFGPADVRFILNVEISCIYKKQGATRKVHNLVFMPDLDSMERFNKRLERIGNIRSDGRPILGLDSRDLLETALETTAESFLIPAHVWTPWFSVLGSKSGFDSVEECFGDLARQIFALETGLSSDPEMNYRVKALDNYTLISNSDTHSPPKLGREVNVLAGIPGYAVIREAIRSGAKGGMASAVPLFGDDAGGYAFETGENRFIGTIEFFPEEGKYHLDGHRKCSSRLDPDETSRLGGRCPVCGQKVTVGVMNRVLELADRDPGIAPERAAPFWRMLPLQEVVAQAIGVGVQSRKVQETYLELLTKLGPELTILWSMPADEIARHASPVIVEAISRVRKGEVSIQAGYDGEYGTVELFGPGEREHIAGQQSLVPHRKIQGPKRKQRVSVAKTSKHRGESLSDKSSRPPEGLNEEQQRAASIHDRPVLVHAGPGTGKTMTLTHRIVGLIRDGLACPEEITAVTFTRKAAAEMRERLHRSIDPERASRCWVGTFHQLGGRILDWLASQGILRENGRVLDEKEALDLFREALKSSGMKPSSGTVAGLLDRVSLLKQSLVGADDSIPDGEAARAYAVYEERLKRENALDLDDLLTEPVRLLQAHPDYAVLLAGTVARHLLVDEFQDVNRAQYELVRLLKGPDGHGLFAIGDPDQAIYGFRGADREFFLRFGTDFPSVSTVNVVRNYRSQANILRAAGCVLGPEACGSSLVPENRQGSSVKIVRLPTPAAEATYIAGTIEEIMGGTSFFALDASQVGSDAKGLSFGDFAVLFRLNAVGDALEEALKSSGIPFQRARRPRPELEAEELDPRAEAVTLMTVHASKGLEFPVVFIAGCEEGLIPYVPPEGPERGQVDLGEERRLLYVAMTRARAELFVTRSERRTIFGRNVEYPESSFLADIDPAVCEFLSPLSGQRAKKDSGPRQCDLFG